MGQVNLTMSKFDCHVNFKGHMGVFLTNKKKFNPNSKRKEQGLDKQSMEENIMSPYSELFIHCRNQCSFKMYISEKELGRIGVMFSPLCKSMNFSSLRSIDPRH